MGDRILQCYKKTRVLILSYNPNFANGAKTLESQLYY